WEISGSVNLYSFGEATFNFNVEDYAGNQISIFSTTDGTNIQLDGNAPVLDEVLLSTSNDNQSLAKGGDFITLTIEASETIRKPDVKLLGNNLFAAATETDLIGFYPFSGNPRDYSGNSHHAFPEGSIVLGGDRFGNDNQSYAFDGVDDYLKIQHHTDFNLSNQISISVWAKANSLSKQWQAILTKGDSAYRVHRFNSTNELAWGTSGLPNTDSSSGISINDGAWHHFVTTFDGNQKKIYVDNILESTVNAPGSISSNTFDIFIGENSQARGRYFHGSIDDVRIYKKVLSVQEIGSLYLNESQSDKWIAHYRVQEGDNGSVNFEINYQDIAGNPGNLVVSTTDRSQIFVDTEVPFLSSVNLSSNNDNGSLAKLGNILTLSFSASEVITPHSVEINGIPANLQQFGQEWIATRNIVSNETQGQATFLISITDAAGNSDSFNQTTDNTSVFVDLVEPIISSVSITSTNKNPDFAKYGDNLTLSFSTSEPIQDPTDNISVDGLTGIVVVGNDDKTEWTVTGQVASDASGMANYSISVKDMTGNVATPVTSTTSINLDTESPSLNNVVLTTSNTNTSFAKAGDNLTLTFNSSELIETPLVTLAGDNLSVRDTNSGAGTSWQATYMVQDGDNGTVAFSIQFQDQAGNTDDNVTITDSKNIITIDTTAPTLSLVDLSSSNTDNSSLAKAGDTVTLSFTSSESLNDPVVSLAGETQTLHGDGTSWSATYTVQAGDDAGTSPEGMSGLVLWLDASNVDGKNNSTLEDQDDVGQWTDLSGRGHHAVQSSSSARPLFANSTIEFDGVDDYLKSPLKIQDSSMYVLLVYESVSASDSTLLFGNYQTATTAFMGLTTGASGKLAFVMRGSDGYEPSSLTSEVVKGDGKYHLLGAGFFKSENSREMRIDGAMQVQAGLGTLNPNSGQETIIGSGHLNRFVKGRLKEVIYFENALSSEKVVRLQAYLAEKWGLGGAVDSDGDGTADISDPTPAGEIAQPKPMTLQIVFEDKAGNEGTVVTQTGDGSSVGMDTTAPSVSSVSIVSDNADTTLAKAGEEVKLSFTTSEPVRTPTASDVTMGSLTGVTITPQDDQGKSWKAVGTVPTSADGNAAFSITVQDRAGNTSIAETSTTDQTSVTLDTIAPTLSSVTLASNNLSKNRAKSGDNLTLSFTSSEPIPVPTVTLAGSTTKATSGNGTDWQAVHPVGNNTSNGSASFSISFVDEAGNVGTVVTSTTDQSSVNVDTTTPTLTLVKLKSNNSDNTSLAKFGDTVTLEFDASETIEAPSVRINAIESTVSFGSDTDWMATYSVPDYRAKVSTYAGQAGVSGLVNAQGSEARMKYPYGLAYDSAGNLYFSDQGNHSIRKIDISGNITTFAGSGISGSADGQGLSASFNNPYGIVFDQADNLYVVDNLNRIIRKIDPSGYVSTFAGNGTASLIDGQGTEASFNKPTNIAIDSSGNLYVSEYGSSSIRKITPDANVTTFAGTGSSGSNNGQGTSASFDRPYGLIFDSSSNLYVGDYGNHVIRKIDPSGNVTTFA
ncbi:MAG: LamG-like jellyroll fold domain-containing protein, partial [Verrucomicrobiota bacterium]|nr:LamG-like jellyroll fold domain-containing protein [Verrucomicrobiota bacterium]